MAPVHPSAAAHSANARAAATAAAPNSGAARLDDLGQPDFAFLVHVKNRTVTVPSPAVGREVGRRIGPAWPAPSAQVPLRERLQPRDLHGTGRRHLLLDSASPFPPRLGQMQIDKHDAGGQLESDAHDAGGRRRRSRQPQAQTAIHCAAAIAAESTIVRIEWRPSTRMSVGTPDASSTDRQGDRALRHAVEARAVRENRLDDISTRFRWPMASSVCSDISLRRERQRRDQHRGGATSRANMIWCGFMA